MDHPDPAAVDPFAGEGALLPEQWGAVIEACPDAVLVVDAQRKIRGWNQMATLLFGYQHSEAIGEDFSLLLPDHRRESGELDWLSAWNEGGGTVRDFLTERRTKDGQIRLVRLSRHIFRNAEGGVSGAIAILRDVSETERELRRATDALHLARLGQLAAQIAHEMRNPLAGIHGALQVLKRRLNLEAEELGVFEDVADEVRRLDRLVQDLQRFARPASSQLTELDLSPWLHEASRKWHEAFAPAQIDLDLETGIVLTIDPVQLEQILEELLGNSRDALAEEQLRVRITLRRTERGCELLFQDNGPGVTPELQSRLFEPFVTHKARGSGLGLAVARRHAETLGGSLNLAASDSGACFRLALPLA